MNKHKWIKREACFKCGTTDSKLQHLEGYSFCFSCNTYFDRKSTSKKNLWTRWKLKNNVAY